MPYIHNASDFAAFINRDSATSAHENVVASLSTEEDEHVYEATEAVIYDDNFEEALSLKINSDHYLTIGHESFNAFISKGIARRTSAEVLQNIADKLSSQAAMTINRKKVKEKGPHASVWRLKKPELIRPKGSYQDNLEVYVDALVHIILEEQNPAPYTNTCVSKDAEPRVYKASAESQERANNLILAESRVEAFEQAILQPMLKKRQDEIQLDKMLAGHTNPAWDQRAYEADLANFKERMHSMAQRLADRYMAEDLDGQMGAVTFNSEYIHEQYDSGNNPSTLEDVMLERDLLSSTPIAKVVIGDVDWYARKKQVEPQTARFHFDYCSSINYVLSRLGRISEVRRKRPVVIQMQKRLSTALFFWMHLYYTGQKRNSIEFTNAQGKQVKMVAKQLLALNNPYEESTWHENDKVKRAFDMLDTMLKQEDNCYMEDGTPTFLANLKLLPQQRSLLGLLPQETLRALYNFTSQAIERLRESHGAPQSFVIKTPRLLSYEEHMAKQNRKAEAAFRMSERQKQDIDLALKRERTNFVESLVSLSAFDTNSEGRSVLPESLLAGHQYSDTMENVMIEALDHSPSTL